MAQVPEVQVNGLAPSQKPSLLPKLLLTNLSSFQLWDNQPVYQPPANPLPVEQLEVFRTLFCTQFYLFGFSIRLSCFPFSSVPLLCPFCNILGSLLLSLRPRLWCHLLPVFMLVST